MHTYYCIESVDTHAQDLEEIPMSMMCKMTKQLVTSVFTVATFFACLSSNAAADEIVLTITTPKSTTELSMASLMALPVTTFTTSTIWTEGDVTFSGTSLHDLFSTYDIMISDVSAVAINDYKVTIPATDAVEGGPIVAYTMNGEAMQRRAKGPLWIVYPYDSVASYRTETVYSRSIWQLNRLEAQ